MKRRQGFREKRVNAQIAGKFDRSEFRQIDAVVQDRPQHAVGKAVVIFLKIGRRQIERDERPSPTLNDRRRAERAILAHLPAPAEPDALAPFQRRVDGDGQASGLTRHLGVGNGDPIRHDDQPRRHTSSHLTDRRIAELMMPAIE